MLRRHVPVEWWNIEVIIARQGEMRHISMDANACLVSLDFVSVSFQTEAVMERVWVEILLLNVNECNVQKRRVPREKGKYQRGRMQQIA
jgi:hypothetical protein